jgi:hypothetical protein
MSVAREYRNIFHMDGVIYAVCDEGHLWMLRSPNDGWFQIPDLPEKEMIQVTSPDGNVSVLTPKPR